MKLEEFLFLIQDEEARIELKIDEDKEEDYQYRQFWLSDFRSNIGVAKHYRDYNVSSFSFEPEEERTAQIKIVIKKKL